MATINVGKIRPVFKGDYSSVTTCTYYDVYKYEGSWWLHIGASPTTGVAPTEGDVWTVFGAKGDPGSAGSAATISVGTTTTGEAGTQASVTNSGTSSAAIFNFTIPKGDTGAQGQKGDTGEPFSVYRTYASIALMNADAANVPEGKFVCISSNTEDPDNGKLYLKGASTFSFVTDLSGAQGMKGDAATIAVGTTTTGGAGTQASVTNSGTSSAAVFNFVIPQGAKGDTGDPGAAGSAATISVGTTTTGAAGTSASVTNSGTSSAAVFNFTIPKGDKGDTGDTGASVTAISINNDGELLVTIS